ncbi:MAG: hypothetical protein HZC36_04210 [Armatimonadetes bacterium]|nr:hypothetical protein [Armatimonadota bacterium]
MRRVSFLRRLGRFGFKLFKWAFALALLAAGGGWLWVRQDFADAASELAENEQRARELGIPLTPQDMRPHPPIADKDNAAPLYRQAIAAIQAEIPNFERVRYQMPSEVMDWVADPLETHHAELAASFKKFDPAIKLLEEGSKRPHCDFERDFSKGPNLLFPEFADMKAMAKLVGARGLFHARRGHTREAIEDFDTVSRVAAHVGEEPILIGALVSISIDSIAMAFRSEAATVWADDPSALAQLAESMKHLPAKADVEKCFKGEAFYGYYTARHWVSFFQQLRAENEDAFGYSSESGWLLPPTLDREMVCRAYASRTLDFWCLIFEEAKHSGFNPIAVGDRMDRLAIEYEFSRSHRPSNLLSSILFPVFAQAGRAFVNEEARRRVVEAELGVLAYRAKHKRLPKSLAEAGVHAVDPFNADPLKYVVKGDTFRVYSVGQDLKDDGGLTGAEYERSRRFGDDYGRDTVAYFPASDRRVRPIGPDWF